MRKYLRLLRLQDQYPVFGGALAAGILLDSRAPWIIHWALSCTAVSIAAFILNEIIDSKDVDKLSWNSIHIQKNDAVNIFIAWALYWGFIFVGISIALQIGLFWWAVLMAFWCSLYSLPPVRLKSRFVWDVLTQVGAGWMIPFGVPFVISRAYDQWSIIVAISLFGWAIVFPYQLADFSADKKVGFQSTHIVLGMKKSLWLGMVCALGGMIIFFMDTWHIRAPWLNFFPLLSLFSVVCSLKWLRMHTVKQQELAFRSYVRHMKPFTQLLLPYIIVLWFFV